MRRPSLPLPATSTEYPAVTSARVMKSRILGSSSTTRMREPAWLCAGTAVVMKRLANHLTLAGLCPRRSALPGCALAGLPCRAVPSPVSLARPLGADGARAPGGWLSGENPPRQARRQLATRKPLHDCYLQGIPLGVRHSLGVPTLRRPRSQQCVTAVCGYVAKRLPTVTENETSYERLSPACHDHDNFVMECLRYCRNRRPARKISFVTDPTVGSHSGARPA